MILSEFLAEVEKLDAKATKGEWFRWTNSGDVSSKKEDCILFLHQYEPNREDDCDFVCRSRTLLPLAAKIIEKVFEYHQCDKCKQEIESILREASDEQSK